MSKISQLNCKFILVYETKTEIVDLLTRFLGSGSFRTVVEVGDFWWFQINSTYLFR